MVRFIMCNYTIIYGILNHMKYKFSSPLLPFSHYIISFFTIQILWAVGGNYITQQLLYITQTSLYAANPILLYGIQHANFFFLLIVLIIFIRIVSRTSFLSFISDYQKFNYKGLLLGMSVWLIAMIVNSIFTIIFFDEILITHYIDDINIHLLMFFVALICSPVQALGEEILFRALFYRAFNHVKVHKYLVALISAILFTLAHSLNAELKMENSFFLVLTYYFLSGFFFMLIVYHHKGIEVALGAHIMNNFYIATIMNYRHSSIISHPFFIINETNIYLDIILLILSSLILLIIPAIKSNDHIEAIE
ncbi:MAG: CPBP family intramembrane metalloprotease [Spirochaetia bacterium]|nr:CPBP family intramembrane metalloprotease [Spirochaetia bacterium]